MSLFKRRLLFIFFVFLFCLLVPIVLLYATGNTINWRRFSLEKTASILIDSKPREARVYINGGPVKQEVFNFLTKNKQAVTKTKISGLTPGEYSIKLEQDGYWPWEERFTLRPEEALNFGIIKLFKKTDPEIISEISLSTATFSPDGKTVAAIQNGALNLIDVAGTKRILPSLTFSNQPIVWSKDNAHLSVGEYLINTADLSAYNFNTNPKKNINKIRWDNQIAYGLAGSVLWRYDSQTNTASVAKNFTETIIDFQIIEGKIYALAKKSNGAEYLLVGALNDTLTIVSLSGAGYYFLPNSERIIIANSRHAYIVDEPLRVLSKMRLLEISNTVSIGRWRDGSFIYSTPFELRIWNGENNDYLQTRFGAPIKALLPLENATVIADQHALQLYVTSRQPFSIPLAAIQNITDVRATSDATSLFILGEYKNAAGLYRLEL